MPTRFITRLHFEQFLTPWAQYLRPYPVLLSWLTRGIYWFELIGPLLLFSPFWTTRLRMVAIIAFVLMHAGIGIFMNIGIFTWVAPLSMLGLLPTEVWNKLADRLRTKERLALRIYYDQECLFCFSDSPATKDIFANTGNCCGAGPVRPVNRKGHALAQLLAGCGWARQAALRIRSNGSDRSAFTAALAYRGYSSMGAD